MLSSRLTAGKMLSVSCSAEPPPRYSHFSAAFKREFCVYGGDLCLGINELPTTLHVFSSDAEKWKVTETSGVNFLPPQLLSDGACASSDHHMYIYGGAFFDVTAGSEFYSSLFKLDATSLQWSELSRPGGKEAPMAKRACQMVYCNNKLVLFGGCFDQRKVPTRPGAEYKRSIGYIFTNELHTFDLDEGEESGF